LDGFAFLVVFPWLLLPEVIRWGFLVPCAAFRAAEVEQLLEQSRLPLKVAPNQFESPLHFVG
jgi:hypothetical protein